MKRELWSPQEYDPRHAQGWALSIFFHLAVISLAIALLSDLHLAPQPDAFRWQVSVVDTTGASRAQETVEAPIEPRSSPPSASKPARVQKSNPVPRQTLVPNVAAPESPSHTSAERGQQSVREQTQPMPLDGSMPLLPPRIIEPEESLQSTPSQTATRAPAISPPPFVDNSGPSLSESPPPAALSGPDALLPRPAQDAPALTHDTVDAPPVVSSRIPETSSSTSAPSETSLRDQDARMSKVDFSWLANSLRNKVQESQRYSTVARLNGLEGRVVLRITVKENGELIVSLNKSSGHDVLDQDAMEQVKRLSPLPLSHPLGRTQQVLNLPIIYSLNQ